MRSPGLLRLAIVAMAVALIVMLVVCVVPTPLTLACFLGAGLGVAALGVLAFVIYVMRDLRARGAL
jgi:hypothetical protein